MPVADGRTSQDSRLVLAVVIGLFALMVVATVTAPPLSTVLLIVGWVLAIRYGPRPWAIRVAFLGTLAYIVFPMLAGWPTARLPRGGW
jgi:hypothetical protein